MQLDVDFDVWKALTLRRSAETVSYNDVLRELLQLGPSSETAAPSGRARPSSRGGIAAVGRHLPAGTRLRARYKGELQTGEIADGRVVLSDGRVFRSLSAAARGVTGTSVNGLRFWKALRPGDLSWSLVLELPKTEE